MAINPKLLTGSRQQLAHALDLSPRRVSELIANGDLPKPLRFGAYDLIASMRAYVTFLRSNHNTLSAERTRLTKARADREELNLRTRAGELVEVTKVKQQYFEMGRQIRDSLQSIPDRLAGIIAAESDQSKVHTVLTKEIHQSLVALTG